MLFVSSWIFIRHDNCVVAADNGWWLRRLIFFFLLLSFKSVKRIFIFKIICTYWTRHAHVNVNGWNGTKSNWHGINAFTVFMQIKLHPTADTNKFLNIKLWNNFSFYQKHMEYFQFWWIRNVNVPFQLVSCDWLMGNSHMHA